MIDEKLKSDEYYIEKLNMLLRSSESLVEHLKTYISVLRSLDDTGDKFLEQLDFLNEETLKNKVNEIDETKSDLIDKIAELFGVRRNLDVFVDANTALTIESQYEEEGGTGVPISVVGDKVLAKLSLTNLELQKLIWAKVIANIFDGTRGQVTELYKKANLPIMILNGTISGTADVYLHDIHNENYNITPNLQYLFGAGQLTLASMGIIYNYNILESLENIGIWDSNLVGRRWDEGRWS